MSPDFACHQPRRSLDVAKANASGDSPLDPKADRTSLTPRQAKLMKKLGFAPRRLVTDKLPSYGAAKAELGMTAEHEKGLRKNNRAENSHQPVRRRERKMQRFKSAGPAQRFLALHAAVYNTFNVQRHLISRRTLHSFRAAATAEWRLAAAA